MMMMMGSALVEVGLVRVVAGVGAGVVCVCGFRQVCGGDNHRLRIQP